MTTRVHQYLRAPNDPSGNPRHLIVVYEPPLEVPVTICQYGYGGPTPTQRDMMGTPLLSLDISFSEYARLLQYAIHRSVLMVLD